METVDTVLRVLVVVAALWLIVVCVEAIVCLRPEKPEEVMSIRKRLHDPKERKAV